MVDAQRRFWLLIELRWVGQEIPLLNEAQKVGVLLFMLPRQGNDGHPDPEAASYRTSAKLQEGAIAHFLRGSRDPECTEGHDRGRHGTH